MDAAAVSGARRARRAWTAEAKAAIVAEARAGAVAATARRHGLRPGQVRDWITQARADAGGMFVPVTVADGPAPAAAPTMIRLEAGGVVARISAGADETTLTRLIRALKAA